MKSRILMCITAITVFAALAIPVQLGAQAQLRNKQQPRYRFVDLGTFGGPNSSVNFPGPIINHAGTVVGEADTSVPCPNNPSTLISPAFQWSKSILNNLGNLSGGCFSLPNAINSRGLIVGAGDDGMIDSQSGLAEGHAIAWSRGQVIDLGTFGGASSLANEVNNRGQAVGFAENTTLDPFNFGIFLFGTPLGTTAWHAALWQNGSIKDLETLGGPDSAAFLVNERGQVAGVSLTNTPPSSTNPCVPNAPTMDPFIWEEGTLADLGSFGGTCGVPGGLNNRGQIVGLSDLPGDSTAHAFLWDRGAFTDLGTLGGSFGNAQSINDAGEAVGTSRVLGDVALHATIWKKGAITDLGTIDGDLCSDAEYINSRGQIVGSSSPQCTFAHTDSRAFLWENGGPMIDLNVFVPPGSGLTLFESARINDRGEIVANGLLPNSDEHVALLIPCGEGEQDCKDAGQGMAIKTQTGAPVTRPAEGAQGSLTPETFAALRAKLFHRFHIPGPSTPKN